MQKQTYVLNSFSETCVVEQNHVEYRPEVLENTIKTIINNKAGTFSLNKSEAIHRWYSYIEGYSSCLIEQQLDMLENENIKTIYDPFAGTGTTLLVAAQRGLQSFYSEVNPFMCEVIEAKINGVKLLIDKGIGTTQLELFLSKLEHYQFQLSLDKPIWGGFEKYFDDHVLSQLLWIKSEIGNEKNVAIRKILLVALASVIVGSSNMIRRGDLRFAKDCEKKPEDFDIISNLKNKITDIVNDINEYGGSIREKTEMLAFDSRDIGVESQIDCVITSPPYLNGTNYIRNTKLELKLFGFIDTENDLPLFHSKGIIAGINNISKRNNGYYLLPIVAPYIEQLVPVAYDQRIVSMVIGYFWDMSNVIKKLSHAIKDDGIFILDIGDSQFAGVHIPTHELLSKICNAYGFVKIGEEILRERRSKNGMVLSQRLLKFRLSKNTNKTDVFRQRSERFISNLPYKQTPYSGRNWGHSWHSLCSYHGKLKPSIAHFLVSEFTDYGDIVLDPLCGVGTIPFEACLLGRKGYGNDLSEMAFAVTKAKVEPPTLSQALTVVSELETFIENNKNTDAIHESSLTYADFGFNKSLSEYFHPITFLEILCARMYFLNKQKVLTSAEAMVFSALLHVLHGNRPYALSRTSHPLTPYAPTGSFIYKNVIAHITGKLRLTYSANHSLPESFVTGMAVWGDYTSLADFTDVIGQVDAVICSPPFADSIRFYMNNWMRLWLSGWESDNYKLADNIFLDVKQRYDFSIYDAFFKTCCDVLKTDGKVILHLGKTEKINMAEILSHYSAPYFYEVYCGSENVEQIEKHGIKDKGGTLEHQYLFLQKK